MSVGLPKTLDGRTVAPLPEEYRMAAKVGDIVRTPWGILGIVKRVALLNGDNTMDVTVLPFSFLLQLVTFGHGFDYYDADINTLTLLHGAERD